jgi:hypothetical protein
MQMKQMMFLQKCILVFGIKVKLSVGKNPNHFVCVINCLFKQAYS